MTDTVQQAINEVETLRTTIRSRKSSSAAFEKFCDDVIVFAVASGSPKTAVEMAIAGIEQTGAAA
ncbi:hypothetical protein ACI2L1_12015 [Streptomyces sp. NPDC019531]|uniref:hypothetical protein n=1 Tax=Streptomyces sp. NPDC019531 TaxID=3365062 RepID=UPI00384CA4B1